MKSTSFREGAVSLIATLYLMLFAYAAVSKLIDYDTFRRQLAMSPVLTSHASWLSWVVPALELVLAALVAFRKTRLAGMYGSLCLMAAFTAYIYLIMNHASHVPCSCGGLLDDMGWTAHFYFNLAFMALASVALALDWRRAAAPLPKRKRYYLAVLALGLCTSVGATAALFVISERTVHYENRFQRRYPHPAATEVAKAGLPHNSYYIAGFDAGRIYLGNVTAPLHLLSCDYGLEHFRRHEIQIDTAGLSFSTAQVRVGNRRFCLANGTVPYVFEGSVSDWKGTRSPAGLKRFTLAEMLGGGMAVRTFSEDGGNLLGFQPLNPGAVPDYGSRLLEKQGDGLFDTDGTLMADGRRFVYLYFYRNEFVVSDAALRLRLRGRTIDTVSRAQVTVSQSRSGLKQLGRAPLLVNRRASLCGNLLFVNSQLPGREDVGKLWKQASIIDVYDIRDGSYRFSFPLYDIDGNKLESFRVFGNRVYLINEKWIVRYDLREQLLDGLQDIPGLVQGSDRKPVRE